MPQYSWEKGWVQRSNRNLYEPNELLDALNVVPDPEGGGVATRLGDTLHATVSGRVHSLYQTYTATHAPVQYQGAGTVLYRSGMPLITGLTGAPISFATLPGYGEKRVYTFFAGGQEALRVKDDGTTLSGWGIRTPERSLTGGIDTEAGTFLVGNYSWRQVFVRKPIISGGVFGRYTDVPGGFTLTGTFPWPLSDALAPNNGTVFAAPQPFDEVVLGLLPGFGVSGGSIDYAFWNGNTWVIFRTAEFPIWTPTMTSFNTRASSLNSWVPANGFYLLRIRLLAMPPVMPWFTTPMTFYDGVYSARSNPSPLGLVSGSYGPAPLPNNTFLAFSDPHDFPDLEPQATHVAIYRTTGDDPGNGPPGELATPTALYFFENDYPAGTVFHSSFRADDTLGELLELDNDRPPAFTTIAEHDGRLFGALGNRLHFSKPGIPDAFPGSNYLEVSTLADPIRGLAQHHGTFYVWTHARVYLLQGTDETSYHTRLVQCPTGLGALQTLAEGDRALYFLGSDGHLWALQGTIAANVSRLGHQQLFEGVTLHGIAGINPAAVAACVGHWGHSRYRLSYPEAPAVVPTTSLLIDEARGSWWRDSRAWQSLFYDRQAHHFYGGLVDGKVVRLDSGLTDHGAAITGTVQTFDDDAQAPDSDKDLSQLTLEVTTSATGILVTPVVSYALAARPLGTVISPTWGQHLLPSPAPGTFRGLTLGYVLTGTAPWALYSLLPTVLAFARRSRVWQTLPSTFGWPGLKILDSLLLDVDLLSGTLAWALRGDGLVVETGVLTTSGRYVVQLLTQRHGATVFHLDLLGTGVFVLYDGSVLSFRPLPPLTYSHIIVPTDLGTGQDKIGLSFLLDIDLPRPGTVTITFYVDGVLIHSLNYSTVERHRTERFRLPATFHGRLMEIRMSSTAPYHLWQGTMLEWQPVGATQSQWYRLVQREYGSEQAVPLLQLPHSEGR